MKLATAFCYIICLVACAESAKILAIFHVPSPSHHMLGDALLAALAKRGHQVTMVSPYVSKANHVENYRKIDLPGLLEQSGGT